MDQQNIITTRTHRIYEARANQIINNLLAWKGGRPYIDARLHRAPNEADISWEGDSASLPGRKGRAYLVNDAGRVVQKINQYLFSSDAKREGIDDAWAQDVTTTNLSIRQFWERVNEQFTTSGWVWLQVDRGAPEKDPATGKNLPRSKADKEAVGDRIYWNIWSSSEVVDWCFDAKGRLLWLITLDNRYDNTNPLAAATNKIIRTLWQANASGCKWTQYVVASQEKNKGPEIIEQGTISVSQVPFILMGLPSSEPWWFDDVEMVQCAMMNLESLHYENLVKTVYPQLVVPGSMIETLQAKLAERYGTDKGERVVEVVRELIRGLDRPFVETAEDKDITRYLQPAATELNILPDYIAKLRQRLFDMVGLALFNKESRQVQSAEAKQFDYLDIEATLQNRALLMQETETKLINLSKALDREFSVYTPVWPQEFNVPTTSEDVASLTQLANFGELPPSMTKRILKTAMKLLDEIEHIPNEERKVIIEEIEMMSMQGEGAVTEIGKVPLAVQQLALARERAAKAGDTEMVKTLGDKIQSLIDGI